MNNSTDMPSIEVAKEAYLAHMAEVAATQDLSQDLRAQTRILSIAFTTAATIFVALRFLARYWQRAHTGTDDWLMLVALGLLYGNLAMNLVLIGQGLGLHSGALSLSQQQTIDKTVLGAEILYVTAVNMYKLSLLFLYFRIFPVRSVHIGGYTCGGISTAWNLACVFAATFQCSPREKLWEPWLEGTCINLFLTQLCIAIPSILCDIAILCLPIPHVWKLKTNLTQRILLIAIFLLGSYVVFTSIYRFRIFLLYTTDDIPYTLSSGCAWNIVEISSGIVSGCLPTLGPIVRIAFRSVMPSSLGSKNVRGSSSNHNKSKQSTLVTIGGTGGERMFSSWNRLGNDVDEESKCGISDLELVPTKQKGHISVTVKGPQSRGGARDRDGNYDKSSYHSDEFPLTAIRRQREVEWIEERVIAGSGMSPLGRQLTGNLTA